MKAFQENEQAAKDIVKAAAASLASQLRKLSNKINVDLRNCPLILYGGLLRYNEGFRKLVVENLFDSEETYNHQRILFDYSSALGPACGAALFALGHSSSSKLELPSPMVISQLRNSFLQHPLSTIKNE